MIKSALAGATARRRLGTDLAPRYGPDAVVENRILDYLSRRVAQPEQLANSVGVAPDEINRALDELERKGWIARGAAWYGPDPSTGITVIRMTPQGRAEADRLARGEWGEQPVELTREELFAELHRRLDWTDEQMAMNPALRGRRFYFYPSMSAWSVRRDD